MLKRQADHGGDQPTALCFCPHCPVHDPRPGAPQPEHGTVCAPWGGKDTGSGVTGLGGMLSAHTGQCRSRSLAGPASRGA